jgi:isochorismate synthase / 2-succinyl-5-enolpyruvyl-6-hydroxy-3-cyclohexene-1-carboxylate synthase / 2-succinyl-6-hydroxy-2,4-cyclohexadiene-1-carboxylate synthase / o-succinylbenzoate synthase
MIEPIFVIMMFDTFNARDLSLSLFFAFLSSYGSFSCVSFSDSFTFLLICFLKNSSLHERQERTFPSLPLSLFSYYFVLEKGREHLVIVFSKEMTTTTGLLVCRSCFAVPRSIDDGGKEKKTSSRFSRRQHLFSSSLKQRQKRANSSFVPSSFTSSSRGGFARNNAISSDNATTTSSFDDELMGGGGEDTPPQRQQQQKRLEFVRLQEVSSENTIEKAIARLRETIESECGRTSSGSAAGSSKSGMLRFRCFVPRDANALQFLSSMNKGTKTTTPNEKERDENRLERWTNTTPRFYFSPRSPPPKPVRQEKREEEEETKRGGGGGSEEGKEVNEEFAKDTRGAMAAIGASCLWTSTIPSSNGIDDDDSLLTKRRLRAVREFLKVSKNVKAFGAGRFDPSFISHSVAAEVDSNKWECFGSRYVFIPIVDVSESISCGEVGVNISWDDNGIVNDGSCAKTLDEAVKKCLKCLESIEASLKASAKEVKTAATTTTTRTPSTNNSSKRVSPDEETWQNVVSGTIEKMNALGENEEDDIKLLLGTSFDEDAFAEAPMGSAERLRSALKNMGRRNGINADESILDVFENLVSKNRDDSEIENEENTGVTLQELPDDDSPRESDDDDDDDDDAIERTESASGKRSLRKVVLARKTTLDVSEFVSECELIESLQRRDPDAYQFILTHPSGTSFIGSSPERLFKSNITSRSVESEAVAGTRPRGSDPGEDAALAYDMLLSEKEHEEFAIVREDVRKSLAKIARDGDSGVFKELEKGILRHVSVQHLYARFRAKIDEQVDESDVISALHPTPAVCGYPRDLAMQTVRKSETFDRGLYAGPLGWIDSEGAEFCVAIRSALLSNGDNGDNKVADLFAGVGVVKAANAKSEWQELNLKTKPMEALLLQNNIRNIKALAYFPNNPNARAAYALVDELVLNGVQLFCIAPGSRSTPLALAAENHPSAKVVVCIDERSLGFYALGFGKGAGKPCAIIVSSGTAVANLLPSFVEAHESQTPAIYLTADRPQELRDTGANQTIDQIDIFQNFRRYFVDAPVPGDLQTNDEQVQTFRNIARVAYGKSTDVAHPGPVHVNLPFREPLGPRQKIENNVNNSDGASEKMSLATMESIKEEVKKVRGDTISDDSLEIQDFSVFESAANQMKESKRGVLIIGGSANPKDALMSAMAAKVLGWAVLADVTSGLRVGVNGSPTNLNVVKCYDYLLCSAEAVERFSPDCIVQLGSRIVSKRLCKFVDDAAAADNVSYIVVDPSPRNFDPSHVVSHRIQCSRDVFASAILKAELSSPSDEQKYYAKTFVACGEIVSDVLSRRILKMDEQNGITEMSVAAEICNALPKSSALFLGNSMPIRDADALTGIKMYSQFDEDIMDESSSILGNPVVANRGASGIDGIISTAAGYACGLNRPVTLFIGDVSFQHDSNGLLFLRERPGQPPVTVVVVNNGGGGIFGFLPVSDEVERETFEKLFATPPDTSRRLLCEANRVAFAHPRSMHSFSNELATSYGEGRHRVIEVTTSRPQNLEEHRSAQRQAVLAVEHFLKVENDINNDSSIFVESVSVSTFDEPLRAKDTTKSEQKSRHGFLLEVKLGDGTVGYGECSPLPGLHDEAECALAGAQLQVFCESKLLGKNIPASVTSLRGQFAKWFAESSISENTFASLFPSVRFCIETAVLNALANATSAQNPLQSVHETSNNYVSVNCLFDPDIGKSDEENAKDLKRLFEESPYKCVKVKVGRDENVLRDATRLKAFRDILGADVEIRADANRAWSLEDAILFGKELERLRDVNLQFIEEPTKSEKDLEEFFFNTNVFYALDETVDAFIKTRNKASFSGDIASSFYKRILRNRLGCAAIVLKPSIIGGVEITKDICDIVLELTSAIPVISSAFESPVAMTMNAKIAETLGESSTGGVISHGLDTGRWFVDETLNPSKSINETSSVCIEPNSFEKEVATKWAQSHFSPSTTATAAVEVKQYNVMVEKEGVTHDISLEGYFPSDTASSSKTVLFLHGFMGDKSDWSPIAKSLATLGHRCVAIDLPGHGETKTEIINSDATSSTYSIEGISDTLRSLLEKMEIEDVTLVGYSLGARVALSLSLSSSKEWKNSISSVISLSGTCGMLGDDVSKETRCERDAALAKNLRTSPSMLSFCTTWYEQPMWKPLVSRDGMSIEEVAWKRATSVGEDRKDEIANVLEHASVGKQKHVWDELETNERNVRVTFIYGELDEKFASIAEKAVRLSGNDIEAIEIENAGHAVHLEQGCSVALELAQVLSR